MSHGRRNCRPILQCFGNNEAMVAVLMTIQYNVGIPQIRSSGTDLPLPTEVAKIAVREDLAIISWIDRELRVARIAGYSMDDEWPPAYRDEPNTGMQFHRQRPPQKSIKKYKL